MEPNAELRGLRMSKIRGAVTGTPQICFPSDCRASKNFLDKENVFNCMEIFGNLVAIIITHYHNTLSFSDLTHE